MLPRPSKTKRTGVVVRKATRLDSPRLVELIVGLAKFERLRPPDPKAKARLAKDIFDKKWARVFVASIRGKLVGYALYFYTYSSFVARPTLYLEDIFVEESSRQEGVGRALFLRCVEEAARLGCGRMEWQVLTWNTKAMRFYQNLGAGRIDDLRLFRLNREGLLGLSKRSVH
jgi:GNAT superfamily N-acetyltransferase